MPPIVSKLKGEKIVLIYTLNAKTSSLPYCGPPPPPPHLPFPSLSDVAEAQSYSASTVHIMSPLVKLVILSRGIKIFLFITTAS
jgi:hypothetical protein